MILERHVQRGGADLRADGLANDRHLPAHPVQAQVGAKVLDHRRERFEGGDGRARPGVSGEDRVEARVRADVEHMTLAGAHAGREHRRHRTLEGVPAVVAHDAGDHVGAVAGDHHQRHTATTDHGFGDRSARHVVSGSLERARRARGADALGDGGHRARDARVMDEPRPDG
jgi:hypothetical protein